MQCMRCKDKFGSIHSNHHMIDMNLQMDFPIDLCNKHRNFKPNKYIVWIESTYFTYWTVPKSNKRIYGDTYKEGLKRYFRFKGWQMANHKGPYYK